MGFLFQYMVLKREDHLLVGWERDGRERDPFGFLLADGIPLALAPAWLGPGCPKGIFLEQFSHSDNSSLPCTSLYSARDPARELWSLR